MCKEDRKRAMSARGMRASTDLLKSNSDREKLGIFRLKTRKKLGKTFFLPKSSQKPKKFSWTIIPNFCKKKKLTKRTAASTTPQAATQDP
jgi:hypothetical protein